MVNLSLTKKELMGIAVLVNINRDSAKLQKESNLDYLESIQLKNKLGRLIDKNISMSEQDGLLDRK